MSTSFRALLRRLLDEEHGQDLVEYALLTAAVGLAGAVAAPYISTAVSTVYGTWVVETNDLWQSPNPAGS